MITNLLLHNFKSHKKTDLRFSNLTVLTGINSAGKSSVIQSLLLLRQSHQKNTSTVIILHNFFDSKGYILICGNKKLFLLRNIRSIYIEILK
ncbi:AAA family ATPase [Bacteroides fragilis]